MHLSDVRDADLIQEGHDRRRLGSCFFGMGRTRCSIPFSLTAP